MSDLSLPLSPAEIIARLMAVDRATLADAIQTALTTDRPAGVQIVAAPTIAEVQRLNAARAFPYLNPSYLTFLSAR